MQIHPQLGIKHATLKLSSAAVHEEHQPGVPSWVYFTSRYTFWVHFTLRYTASVNRINVHRLRPPILYTLLFSIQANET